MQSVVERRRLTRTKGSRAGGWRHHIRSGNQGGIAPITPPCMFYGFVCCTCVCFWKAWGWDDGHPQGHHRMSVFLLPLI